MFTTLMLAAASAPGWSPPEVTTRTDTRSYSWGWSQGTKMPDLKLDLLPWPPMIPDMTPWPDPPRGWPKLEPLPDLPKLDIKPEWFPPHGRSVTYGFDSRSVSSDVRRAGDRFTAKLSDTAGSVVVTGKVEDDRPVMEKVVVHPRGGKAESHTPADIPAGRKEAVKWLLKQIR